MMGKLQPYTEYKGSKVSWLNKMPNHWEIDPGLAAFSTKKEKNIGLKETTVLSLSYGRIVVKPPEKLHGLVPESFETYQIVNPGDIIIRSTDLQNDWNSLRVGLVEDRGIITSAYICLKTKERMIPAYCHLLLHSYDLMKIFYGMGSGLRQNLDWPDFKRLPVLIPPIDEQKTIVSFIKMMSKKIARFIKTKKRLIEVLKEQKQVIINHAVTKGIDPNVKLKPSSVDYLGDIPEHWEVKPLKHWVKINNQTLTDTTDPDYGFDYLDIGSVSTGFLSKTPEHIFFRNAPSRARRVLQKGDTIISTVRTYLKAIYFIENENNNLIASTGFAVLTPRKNVYPKLLSYIMQSKPFIDKVTANSIGIAYPAIAETRLAAFHIAVPTAVEEQVNIVNKIETESASIDVAIKRALNEIELLHEYRTRLIADVVTGKVDVQDIPVEPVEDIEEIEELEEIQEGEELTELQEVTDADD